MKFVRDIVELARLATWVALDLLRPSRPEYRLPARWSRG